MVWAWAPSPAPSRGPDEAPAGRLESRAGRGSTTTSSRLTLFLASMVAFAVTRFNWKFNLRCLMLLAAANLLPPQVIIVPLYRVYNLLPLPAPLSDNGVVYDQYVGIILIHVAFQTGFCMFVLSNYM